MKIIGLLFKIPIFVFLGVACHRKERIDKLTPDLVAYDQLSTNHFVRMQPRSIAADLKSPESWVSHHTSLGIKVLSPPDWRLVQQDEEIAINSSVSNLSIKIQLKDNSSYKLNTESRILSIQDFSSYERLDEILSAKLPGKNAFSRMDENQKKDVIAQLGKKIFFFSKYNEIYFYDKKYYLFKATKSNEIMALLFFGAKNEVVNIGGTWRGDENELLLFLEGITSQ